MAEFLPLLEVLHPQFKEVLYCAPNGTKPPAEYEKRFLLTENVMHALVRCV